MGDGWRRYLSTHPDSVASSVASEGKYRLSGNTCTLAAIPSAASMGKEELVMSVGAKGYLVSNLQPARPKETNISTFL